MARCVYCGDRKALWSKRCGDCKKLLAKVNELRGVAGYGEFLDGLAKTGVPREKIIRFLKADPFGTGSVEDQVTAEMVSSLMKVMGLKGSQTPDEVKRIRETIHKEER